MLYIVIVIVLILVIVYLARSSNVIIMYDDNTFNLGVSLIAMNIVSITL
jgi:ABC-type enterobactin transport system permease subunit